MMYALKYNCLFPFKKSSTQKIKIAGSVQPIAIN